MQVGSLLRNKSFPKSIGIVLRVRVNDVCIHWIKEGYTSQWPRYSRDLEVICK